MFAPDAGPGLEPRTPRFFCDHGGVGGLAAIPPNPCASRSAPSRPGPEACALQLRLLPADLPRPQPGRPANACQPAGPETSEHGHRSWIHLILRRLFLHLSYETTAPTLQSHPLRPRLRVVSVCLPLRRSVSSPSPLHGQNWTLRYVLAPFPRFPPTDSDKSTRSVLISACPHQGSEGSESSSTMLSAHARVISLSPDICRCASNPCLCSSYDPLLTNINWNEHNHSSPL